MAKIFKEKIMKGINIVQFIDCETFNKINSDLFIITHGLNRAFIVNYDEEINIIIIKNRKINSYFMNSTSLPLLHELYDHLSSRYLTNFIDNQRSKHEITHFKN